MTQEDNKQNTIRFENAQELMDYIGVSRATLYRRMNAYNMKSSKRLFTQDELELLNRFMAKVKTNITLIESEKITE